MRTFLVCLPLFALAACHSSSSHHPDGGSENPDASLPDGSIVDGSAVVDAGSSDGATGPDMEPAIDLGTINHCTTECPDLVLNGTLLASSIVIETREFADPANFDQTMPHVGSDCSVAEGSVGAAGVRRLLRFSTQATNEGAGDLLLGSPTDPATAGFFVYAPCHGHYHFLGFADYQLIASDGSLAVGGHKQAFCIEDGTDVTGVEPNPAMPTNCDMPGLHRGWSDTYTNYTEANWIDITGLPAGQYTLKVSLNDERVIVESDYTNNDATVTNDLVDDPHPEICPSTTEALYRCFGTGEQQMTRCYEGVRNTETCSSLGPCVQPTEIAHQAHCNTGSPTSVSTVCPTNTSTMPSCTQVVDPMSGAMVPVLTWCANGIVNTEYCGTTCTTPNSGAASCM